MRTHTGSDLLDGPLRSQCHRCWKGTLVPVAVSERTPRVAPPAPELRFRDRECEIISGDRTFDCAVDFNLAGQEDIALEIACVSESALAFL